MKIKYKKGYFGTEPNSVAISEWCILFGKNVANWLRKQNISKVILVFDYKHNSVVFIRHDLWGLCIQYPKNDWADALNVRTMIYFNKPDKTKRNFVLRAKILNKDSILLENAPLNKFIMATSKRICIDIEQNLIIVGNFYSNSKVELRLTEKDLIKPNQIQSVSLNINKQGTATPSQLKIQSTQLTSTSSQLQTPTKPMVDRRYDPNEVSENVDENLSRLEAIEKADKEYSKMILGE